MKNRNKKKNVRVALTPDETGTDETIAITDGARQCPRIAGAHGLTVASPTQFAGRFNAHSLLECLPHLWKGGQYPYPFGAATGPPRRFFAEPKWSARRTNVLVPSGHLDGQGGEPCAEVG